jgi:hypothetical protein
LGKLNSASLHSEGYVEVRRINKCRIKEIECPEIKGKDPKSIYAVGNLYTGTLDAKLCEMDIGDEPDIDNHP